MTPNQRLLLACVHQATTRDGYPPTMREVAQMMGVCVATAQWYKDHAVRAGYLLDGAGRARALRLTPAGLSALGVPNRVTWGAGGTASDEVAR